jgi:hypothetical protein
MFTCCYSDNISRLECLDEEKMPYLFPSEVMMKIVALTPSIRTKIAIITMLGPRLIDPNEHMAELIELFPYSEEKEKVADVLKGRAKVLGASMFKGRALNPASGRGGAGRGAALGRGPAGRSTAASGRGFTPSSTKNPAWSSAKQVLDDDSDTIAASEQLSEQSSKQEAAVAMEISKSITEKRQIEQAKPASVTVAKVTHTPFVPSSSQPEDPVSALIREKESMPMMQNIMKKSNDNLAKLVSSPEKPMSADVEKSIQASAAILTSMFPNLSSSDSNNNDKFDAIEKFRDLLGLSGEGSFNLNHQWDFKSSGDNGNVKDEIALILKAFKMSSKEAASMIDTEGWEKYLESNDIFVDEEHLRIEREILSVCKALGIKSFVQQRFSQRLENWEEKVVVEKIQKKDDDHGVVLSAAKSKMYDHHEQQQSPTSEDTPSNRSISDSFSGGTRSPNGSLDAGSPPKIQLPQSQSFAARVDKYNRVKGLTNEEIIESLLRASREKRITETLEKPAPQTASASATAKDSFYRPRLSDVSAPKNPITPPPPDRRLSDFSKDFTVLREVYTANAPQEINPGIVRQRSVTFNGGVVVNKRYDEKAAPAAFSLNMDTKTFLSMKPEDSMGFDPVNNVPLFSYKELVRRNHCKEFEGLQHRELEKYLNDEEFQARFCMSKVNSLPMIRQLMTDLFADDDCRSNSNSWRNGVKMH